MTVKIFCLFKPVAGQAADQTEANVCEASFPIEQELIFTLKSQSKNESTTNASSVRFGDASAVGGLRLVGCQTPETLLVIASVVNSISQPENYARNRFRKVHVPL